MVNQRDKQENDQHKIFFAGIFFFSEAGKKEIEMGWSTDNSNNLFWYIE